MSILAQRGHGINHNIQIGHTRILLNPYYMGTVGKILRSTENTWMVYVVPLEGAFTGAWNTNAEICGISLEDDGSYAINYRDGDKIVKVRDAKSLRTAVAVALSWASHAGNARKSW